MSNPDALALSAAFMRSITALVASNQPDLSQRQMAVMLNVYETDGPHTVRGLARTLNVSKPAITRALDRLGELDLVRRKIDPLDRRSVLAQRTMKGMAWMRMLRTTLAQAAEPELPTQPERLAA